MKKSQLQTMSIAFQQICEGEGEWIALGNFMNYWYAYAKERREALIIDPLPAYDEHSLYRHRWAVFCAAAVEWFCRTYVVPCPAWVFDSKYKLAEPWFFYLHEPAKSGLLLSTPQEFTRRNIYCGDNCFANKWEMAEQLRKVLYDRKLTRVSVL